VNGDAILPDRILKDAAVLCVGSKIRALGPRKKLKLPQGAEVIDAKGGLLSPGYIDIHVHGAEGTDYMDGSAEAVRVANRAHAARGTTSIFPTTTTGSRAQVYAMLTACKQVRDSWTLSDGARVAGVHFYGPYFAEAKVGCHLKSGRRNPDPREYKKDFDLGIIGIATCAAELPGAEAFYREAKKRGYLVTCGHSNSTWDEMAAAFKAGMRHVDHFWCAMSSVPSLRDLYGTPMRGSMEQFVLAEPEMSTEVIADGQHLAPELLRFAYQMKGAARLCLCTDSNRAVGMPPGKYRFGPKADGEWFVSDDKKAFQPGAGLASSIVGMDTMVRNMALLAKIPIPDAVRMGSLTPAELGGVAREVGSLEVGKRADVLCLSRDLAVRRVFIGGEEFRPPTGAAVGAR
jgi:N-acetylglucosamine-6-phosphate deacetylase